MDFVFDHLGSTGRRFRCLTTIEEFNHVSLAIEIDTSLSGVRIARVLERIVFTRGLPKAVVVDNEPEFSGRSLGSWAFSKGLKLNYIRPVKAVENAFIEDFNGRFREDCLNEHWFVTLQEAQVRIEAGRED